MSLFQSRLVHSALHKLPLSFLNSLSLPCGEDFELVSVAGNLIHQPVAILGLGDSLFLSSKCRPETQPTSNLLS